MSSRKTNWSLCCLCQKDKRGENLISPPSHHVLDHDGYTMLARNIPMFSEINEMPLIMDPARLDEGDGIEATLRSRQHTMNKHLMRRRHSWRESASCHWLCNTWEVLFRKRARICIPLTTKTLPTPAQQNFYRHTLTEAALNVRSFQTLWQTMQSPTMSR